MSTSCTLIHRSGSLLLAILCCALLLVPQKSSAQQLLLQGPSLYFVKNNGQVFDTRGKARRDVEYVAESPNMNLFFTREGVSYVFVQTTNRKEKKVGSNRRRQNRSVPEASVDSLVRDIKTHKVDMRIVGASPSMTILANDQADQYCNYYHTRYEGGAVERVPVFRKLVYKNVYDNIDLVFYSASQGIKYDFIVNPGGRVSDIKIKYNGASKVKLSQQGALQIATTLGTLEEHKPFTYQERDTVFEQGQSGRKRKKVSSAFRIANDEITFSVDDFNGKQTLVIDPGVRWFSYMGGTSEEYTTSSFAIDTAGNILISGYTNSTNLPVSTTASQTTNGGGSDAFVAKFTRGGKRLWATYYGGSGTDAVTGCGGAAIDNSGNIYIAGATGGGSGFPITSGAFQTTHGGGSYDGYLAKLNSSGTRVWATYFGGNNPDYVYSLAVDSEGNVIIAGETSSSNLPVSSGAFQSTHAGYYAAFAHSNSDCFIAKFSGSGQRLWATYVGAGNMGFERIYAVDCDLSDNIIAVGLTPGVNFLGFPVSYFPVTAGAFQTTYGGGTNDAFVVKFNKTGSRLWGTFFGGSNEDYATGIATGPNNSIVFVGNTKSSDFPANSGAFQTGVAGGYDQFIGKLDSNGVSRQWATLYGGSSDDYANDVITDTDGTVWITGHTASSNFPVTSDAYQLTHKGGNWDASLLKFSSTGSRQWATYVGGSGADRGTGIELDQSDPVLIGYTNSTTLSVSAMAFQPTTTGANPDAFMMRFGSCSITAPNLAGPSPQACQPMPTSVTLDAGVYEEYLWSNGATTRTITVTVDGVYSVTVKDPTGCTATSTPITVDVQ